MLPVSLTSITIADDGGTNHFEVTLFSDGKIKFQYKVSRTTIAELLAAPVIQQ